MSHLDGLALLGDSGKNKNDHTRTRQGVLKHSSRCGKGRTFFRQQIIRKDKSFKDHREAGPPNKKERHPTESSYTIHISNDSASVPGKLDVSPSLPAAAKQGGERRFTEAQCDEPQADSLDAGSPSEDFELQQATCPSTAIITEVRHAGRLQLFYNCWSNITNNPVILNWIENGFSIPFTKQVRQRDVPRNTFSPAEQYEMDKAVRNLLNLGAISICQPCEDQFVSKIFLAPKPNGSKSFILNLKPLNHFIDKQHFKMENYRTAAKLI